jgi:hypothetical protein
MLLTDFLTVLSSEREGSGIQLLFPSRYIMYDKF